MNKDFADFQRYFKEYQELFGLTGYKVYFRHEPLDGCFAKVAVQQLDMVATVYLDSVLPEQFKSFKNIKGSAKHEALHLLVSRLENRAISRFASEDEIYEAVEELVRKLEDLVKEK